MQEVTIQTSNAPRKNVASIILGVLLFLAIITSAGLGLLAYTLNAKLTNTQAELTQTQVQLKQYQDRYTALDGHHAKLTTEHDALIITESELKTELKKSEQSVQKLQTDLKSAQDDLSKLTTKMKDVQKKVELVDTLWFDGATSSFEASLKSINDKESLKLFNNLKNASDSVKYAKAYFVLLEYLIRILAKATW